MELGDMDDPQSQWTFGQPGEIFQYRCMHCSGNRAELQHDPCDDVEGPGMMMN